MCDRCDVSRLVDPHMFSPKRSGSADSLGPFLQVTLTLI